MAKTEVVNMAKRTGTGDAVEQYRVQRLVKYVEFMLYYGIVAAMLVDCYEFAVMHWYNSALTRDVSILAAPSRKASFGFYPVGFDVNGSQLALGDRGADGVMLRYASPSCPYCQADEPRWRELLSFAKKSHVVVVALSPTATEVYDNIYLTSHHLRQISFVSASGLGSIHLIATPTTLLFASDGSLLWAHQGTLTSYDVVASERAMGAMPRGQQ